MERPPRRDEIAAQVARWRDGALDASALRQWAEAAWLGAGTGAGDGGEPPDEVVAEVLADLDLLQVHLLTPADAPALLAVLSSGDLDAWRRYRSAIDLDARSRELRRVPLYRAFCRSGGGGGPR